MGLHVLYQMTHIILVFCIYRAEPVFHFQSLIVTPYLEGSLPTFK